VISPLMKRRKVFAGVDNFLFYDFRRADGSVDEDVFAYSNADGDMKGIVVYNNSHRHTMGWVDRSVPKLVRSEDGSKIPQTRRFCEKFDLDDNPAAFSIFKNIMTGLEYIHSNRTLWEQGLRLDLPPYGCIVYLDHRQVYSSGDMRYDEVARYLGGRGVPNIEEALYEMPLIPIHQSLEGLIDETFLNAIMQNADDRAARSELRDQFKKRIEPVITAIHDHIKSDTDRQQLLSEIGKVFDSLLSLPGVDSIDVFPKWPDKNDYASQRSFWSTALIWLSVHQLGILSGKDSWREVSRSWIDEFRLNKKCVEFLGGAGINTGEGREIVDIVRILVTRQNWLGEMVAGADVADALRDLFRDTDVTDYLKINRYHDILWFNRERFEKLLFWLGFVSMVQESRELRIEIERTVERITAAAEKSGYRVLDFLNVLEKENISPETPGHSHRNTYVEEERGTDLL